MKINVTLILLGTLLCLGLILLIHNMRPRPYVVPLLMGRLGNRIFQVFAAKLYGERYGHEVVFCKNFIEQNPNEEESLEELRRVFPEIRTVDKVEDHEFVDFSKSSWEYKELPYTPKSIVIKGYFQNVRYIPKSIQDSPPIRKRPVLKDTYFIHIRGGDYLTNPRHFVDLRKYYRRSIEKVYNHNPNAAFLVFTDDKTYAERVMSELHVSYRMSTTTNAYETLLEMSSCVGAICANSSFSWIGSFSLPVRTQIYMPSKWSNDNAEKADMYPPWAIVVPVD